MNMLIKNMLKIVLSIYHLSYYELDGEPLYLELAPEGQVNESKDKKILIKI